VRKPLVNNVERQKGAAHCVSTRNAGCPQATGVQICSAGAGGQCSHQEVDVHLHRKIGVNLRNTTTKAGSDLPKGQKVPKN